MPLARDQRVCLARVMAWSRKNGWTHDAYPNSWRRTDGQARVHFDREDNALIVDASRPRGRAAVVPVESPEVAVDVLAALGHVPAELSPMINHKCPSATPCLCAGCHHDAEPPVALLWGDDDPDAFDGPASFLEAGQAFADHVDGRISAERAAEGLSRLARDGLIVSVAYHEEVCGGHAAQAFAAGQADFLTPEIPGQLDLFSDGEL